MCCKNILLGNLQKLLILLRGPKQLQITIQEYINLLTLSLKSFLKAFCFSFYYRVHNNNGKKTKWNLHCSYYPSSQTVKYFWNSQLYVGYRPWNILITWSLSSASSSTSSSYSHYIKYTSHYSLKHSHSLSSLPLHKQIIPYTYFKRK